MASCIYCPVASAAHQLQTGWSSGRGRHTCANLEPPECPKETECWPERCWDSQPPGVLKEAEIKQLAQAPTMGRATQERNQQAIQPQCW